MFLDADDRYREDACKSLYQLAEREKADIIQFEHEIFSDEVSTATMTKVGSSVGKRSLYDLDDDRVRRTVLAHESEILYGCWNKIYRMDLVKRAGVTFAEHVIYEEPKFVYPLCLYAKRVLVIDEKYYLYSWLQGSTMTSSAGTRLLDHPQVQVEILEDLEKREELFDRYYDEIAVHFFYSYYLETIVFSRSNKGELPLYYFDHMQELCRRKFPSLRDNPYIMGAKGMEMVAESIFRIVPSQEVLDELADEIAAAIRQ